MTFVNQATTHWGQTSLSGHKFDEAKHTHVTVGFATRGGFFSENWDDHHPGLQVIHLHVLLMTVRMYIILINLNLNIIPTRHINTKVKGYLSHFK